MAAVDYFLKLDGIDGESSDSSLKGTIEIDSWSWGEAQQGMSGHVGGGSGAGKVAMQDFHFVMRVNKSSPKLMLACATGEHIKKATLTARKAGGEQQEFLAITMSDCLVSSYQTGGTSPADVVPVDQVSLNFSKIEMQYKAQKADGTLDGPVKTGWDVAANKKV